MATTPYPSVPSVMDIPMIQKVRTVLRQVFLDGLSERYRFGNVKPLVCKVTGKFPRELWTNEAHSYAYLLQHNYFNVPKKEPQAKVKDLRANGFYSDPLMLFENFSASEVAVHNTMCYVHHCDIFAQLVLEVQGIELGHCYARIFRAYHIVVAGHSPLLMEYGLTQ